MNTFCRSSKRPRGPAGQTKSVSGLRKVET